MIKILNRLNRYRNFRKEEFKEALNNPANPARGWFDLYAFELDKDPAEFENECKLDLRNSFVLLLIDIAAYRDGDIEDKELEKLERLIVFFRRNKKDIILRVTYDHEGKGMHREPLYFEKVRRHAEKIAEFVSDHNKDIFLYQGLLVGKWGEMHTSRFTSTENIHILYEIFKKRMINPVYMAVRKPVQLRWLKDQPEKDIAFEPGRLGVFNDGMFGSDSDLGTYDNENKDGAWHKSWSREKEQLFTGNIALKVPYGGEALFGESFISRYGAETILNEMLKQHITYLNRKHDRKLIDYWKKNKMCSKGIWNGKSYFDYIDAHLGYRFFVKNVIKTAIAEITAIFIHGAFLDKSKSAGMCFSIYTSSVTSKQLRIPALIPSPHPVKRCETIVKNIFNESALKSISAKKTKIMLVVHLTALGSLFLFFLSTCCSALTRPCITPQRIKVQFAPCQIPLIRKVKSMVITVQA